MTMWRPELVGKGPLYRAIADAIAAAIDNGVLAQGERLPTHRDLAATLGVALTTVTRGYAEAERRGLLMGEVGRGTFVRRWRTDEPADERRGVDLRANSTPPFPFTDALLDAMGRILKARDRSIFTEYQPHRGTARQRQAGARWMCDAGLDLGPQNVLVTSGVQHAMATVLATITDPGDVLVVEELTYGGMKSLANLLRVRLRGVALDDEGLVPDALRAACEVGDVKALYCMPTLQNPTARVMSPERRKAVADIADEFAVPIVEDDSYGFLLPGHPPLTALAHEAYYLCGASKSVAPALRVGFIGAPSHMTDRLEAAISSTIYMASALLADVVAEWILDGTADEVVAWKRNEVEARQAIAQRVLAAYDYGGHERAQHGWLRLPEPWTTHEFVTQASMRGIELAPADDFQTGRTTTHAVRVCVGPPPTRAALQTALEDVAEILTHLPEPRAAVV